MSHAEMSELCRAGLGGKRNEQAIARTKRTRRVQNSKEKLETREKARTT